MMKEHTFTIEERQGWCIENKVSKNYYFEKTEEQAIALYMNQAGYIMEMNIEQLETYKIILYKVYKGSELIYIIIATKETEAILEAWCDKYQTAIFDEEAETILSMLKM